MGEVKIIIDPGLLMKVLHIPTDKDYEIIDARMDDTGVRVVLIFRSEEFPPTPYKREPRLVNPVVSFEPEKYEFDWNL